MRATLMRFLKSGEGAGQHAQLLHYDGCATDRTSIAAGRRERADRVVVLICCRDQEPDNIRPEAGFVCARKLDGYRRRRIATVAHVGTY